jgi:hypothetical protein
MKENKLTIDDVQHVIEQCEDELKERGDDICDLAEFEIRREINIAKTLLEAWELMKPIARAAKYATGLNKSNISPDKRFIWKPYSNVEELPGITVSDILAIQKYLEERCPD